MGSVLPFSNDPFQLPEITDLLLDTVFVVDAEGICISVSAACEQTFGYTRNELLGRRIIELTHPDDREMTERVAAQVRQGVPQRHFVNRYIHKEGKTVHIMWSARWLEHEQLRLAVARDITDLKLAEARLEHLAHHDPLTDLPNRTLFNEALDLGMARALRTHEKLALLYIDLDMFKPVNDRCGHEAGDQLLIAIAQRLNAEMRGSDVVCRLGGDEFAILLTGLSATDNLGSVLPVAKARVDAVFAEPFLVGNERCPMTASLGCALFPDDSIDRNSLFRMADSRMYAAKRRALSA
ncbi:MAG: diguanylate cyclase [unclassified Hahellaceae]|nr:diguanylate cyclase [Hahellaceae bacterium]|tara:strand:- start:37496 stop:38380 length:885 start_codon:yes stop_codon:yes gene_type:complete